MKPLSYKTVADIRLRGLTCWEVVDRYLDTEYHDVVFGEEKNLSRKNDKVHILFGCVGKKEKKHVLGAFLKRYEKREQAGWHYRYHLSSFGLTPRLEKSDFGIYPWSYESNVIEALILAGVWYRIGLAGGLHERFHSENLAKMDGLIDDSEDTIKRIDGFPACWLYGPPKESRILFVDRHIKDQYAVFSVERKSLENGQPSKKMFSDTALRPQSLSTYLQILLNEYAKKHSLSRYRGLTHPQILNRLNKGKGKCPSKPNPYQSVLRG